MNRRPGFTIAEALVVLVVGSILMAAAYRTLISQERSYRVYDAAISTQQATRLSLQVLTAELREISAQGADLTYADNDSISFRALRKFGIICDMNKSLKQITVVRMGQEAFEPGDSLLVFVDGDRMTGDDDRWDLASISGASASLCSSVIGLDIAGSLLGGTQTLLKLSGAPLINEVYQGAPIRSFERLTYGIKEFDGTWYLGRDTVSGTMVPVVGPLAPPSRGGLAFTYYDTLGNVLSATPLDSATRASVRRIEVAVRGQKTTGVGATGIHLDSLITDIYLRGG